MPNREKSEEGKASESRPFGAALARVPAIWFRFLLALVGLALAFAAALFSSVSRQQGNVLATVVLASLALLLATLVGLTTVPYLARRAVAGRVRDAFHYEVTRAGIAYVLVVLVIGVAALNTGNNLLYIIVAAMLGAIWISGFASALVLRKLELDVALPSRVFARQSAIACITVRNQRRFLPSFSISLFANQRKLARKRWRWIPATFAFPPGRPPEEQWLRLPDRRLRRLESSPAAQAIFQDSIYFPYLAAGGRSSAEVRLSFDHRGRYQQHGFDLRTRFPFAFLTKSRRMRTAKEIIVFPSIDLADETMNIAPQIQGEIESSFQGCGSSLYRIRDYAPEDSVRHVDWKATAKSGSLMVKEFTKERERRLRIIFDNPPAGALSAAQYEHAVELTASLGWHFAAGTQNVSFVSQNYSGSPDVYDFLEFLALIQPGPSASILPVLPATEEFSIIVTARHPEAVPAFLASSSHVVALA